MRTVIVSLSLNCPRTIPAQGEPFVFQKESFVSRINTEVGDLPFPYTWQEVTSINDRCGKSPPFYSCVIQPPSAQWSGFDCSLQSRTSKKMCLIFPGSLS